MATLPNVANATVDIAKLRDYCLNPTHPEGKHKAHIFATLLGYMMADAEKLRELILAATLTHEAAQGATDEHGTRYTLDFAAQGLRAMVTIRTAWIIDTGETTPRLVSCYVKRR